jgi:2-polyprenyl-6-methoxyphenol hydroxylase-like FAD-dependent oxidoreductase
MRLETQREPPQGTDGGNTTMTNDHAVVIGASVAGLLAARAASEHFARVTVLDRDTLPDEAVPRRGVPQARQVHALLARGTQVIEAMFPGFEAQLRADGGMNGDAQAQLTWYLDGYRMADGKSGINVWGVSRPLVERRIRLRAAGLANVRIVPETEVLNLITDPEKRRVTGLRAQGSSGRGEAYTIDADLVIDAGGRGSRALTWLEELGYPRPPESRVGIDVVYVTRPFQRHAELLGDSLGGLSVPFPGSPRGWVVISEGTDRVAVCLVGVGGAEPPTDEAGMLAYAETVPGPEAAAYLRAGIPLADATKMRYPASARRHFDRVDRHLAGFLVMGDALCSFDPIYGQGMTSAALQADALRKALRADPARLTRKFYRAAAKAVQTPWLLAAGGDLRFPGAEGRRQPGDGVLNGYLDRLRVAAASDPVVGRAFLRVAQLLAPPASLMSPAMMWRVFRAPRTPPR